jgi:hypothetical protein
VARDQCPKCCLHFTGRSHTFNPMRHLTPSLLYFAFSLIAFMLHAQPVLHWSRGYTTTQEDQWNGLPPKLAKVTCYDRAGRPTAEGIEKAGKFCPTKFWEYDNQGRVTMTGSVDSTGKRLGVTRKVYNAAGQLMQEYYGEDDLHMKLGTQYIYRNNRLWQQQSFGSNPREHRHQEWRYESNPMRITESSCYDSLSQNCNVSSITTWDAQSKHWIKTLGDYPQQGGKFTCLDSACEKVLEYVSYNSNGSLFQKTHRVFDATGHQVHAETIDSVNNYRWVFDWQYDATGNLLEEKSNLTRFGTDRLSQRQQLDAAGRCVAQFSFTNEGVEFQAFRTRYDALGNIAEQWQYLTSGEPIRHQIWSYDAANRCIALADSNGYWNYTSLDYDDRGRLQHKRVIRPILPDLSLKGHDVVIFPSPRDNKQGKNKLPARPPVAVTSPKVEPTVLGWDTTHFGYGYDKFDSLVAVYSLGFHIERWNSKDANWMPSPEAAVGSRAWTCAMNWQADTIYERQNGDTLFQILQDKYRSLNLEGQSQIRKVWKFRGEPIQIQEFDYTGRQLVFWQHADFANAAKIKAWTPGMQPIPDWEQQHTLRILLETYSTELHGDTIFRMKTFSVPGGSGDSRKGYVSGKLVWFSNSQGYCSRLAYDGAGKLIRGTSGATNNQYRTEYRYDSQDRLTGMRIFGFSGDIVDGTDYVYPDPFTKMTNSNKTNRAIKITYQLEFWE